MKNGLYLSLKKIDELASPFINAYSEDSLSQKPISFSFSFKNHKINSSIYLELMNTINAYNSGFTKWIMHKNYSRKNYTIEPILYYYLRAVNRRFDTSQIDNFYKKGFIIFNKNLISDLSDLSILIENLVNKLPDPRDRSSM